MTTRQGIAAWLLIVILGAGSFVFAIDRINDTAEETARRDCEATEQNRALVFDVLDTLAAGTSNAVILERIDALHEKYPPIVC